MAAETLSVSADEARLLGTGLERGEVRAWARRVLKGYSTIGVTHGDLRYVDGDMVTSLQDAWAREEGHPRRSLPLYQEKAAALRGLARCGGETL